MGAAPLSRNRVLSTLARGTAIAAVITQAGIAVTGSVVRVTGSGLGCPTWPQCFPGSLVPQPHPEVAALHQWIEFSNRLLTGLVGLVGLACLIVALLVRPRRRRLILLAAAMPAGVLVQAVLGGITVLAGLAWWTVAVHFLVSMGLVWLAVLLVAAVTEGDAPPHWYLPGPLRGLLFTSTVVLVALLIAGTLVTSAGPHAGDTATPRLAVSVAALAQLHADLLVGFLGLLVGLGFALRAMETPAATWRRYVVLLCVVLAQGMLGVVQYLTGVPEALVSFHVLGAALVVVAMSALWTGCRFRAEVPAAVTVCDSRPLAGAGTT
ncbi:MAG: COX15/CtaA family protein [Actinomycetota bacterium]|nr:COX15/CtaA family protein [Actinomycetota bacterium]MDQ3900531.1 COX15/CtaA family protein [Actinomycetota bacterium]